MDPVLTGGERWMSDTYAYIHIFAERGHAGINEVSDWRVVVYLNRTS